MAEGKGYLTQFKATTLVNHTTLHASDPALLTKKVFIPVETLPSGVKVYYNGTSDSTVTPGNATQAIYATTGGATLYDSLLSQVGNYGVLTVSKINGGSSTCNAILAGVNDTTRFITGAAHIQLSASFELLTDWV